MSPSSVTCKSHITLTLLTDTGKRKAKETVKGSDVNSMALVCFVTTGTLILSAALQSTHRANGLMTTGSLLGFCYPFISPKRIPALTLTSVCW